MSCGCDNSVQTVVFGGDNITVTGSGTPNDPYVVAVSEERLFFQVTDTSSLDFSLIGSGTTDDPYVLSGTASLRLQELADVDDPSGPAVGDVPIYSGSSWFFGPPPTVPPGAVSTTAGIEGDGSVPTPIKIAVSDTVSTATSGLATYIDSAGKLRAVPPASTIAWADITGKPSTFSPIIGTSAITAKAGNWVPAWTEVTGKPSTFAPITGTTAGTAKAGNWLPTWAEVDTGLTISPTAPVGKPDGHIWLKTP